MPLKSSINRKYVPFLPHTPSLCYQNAVPSHRATIPVTEATALQMHPKHAVTEVQRQGTFSQAAGRADMI